MNDSAQAATYAEAINNAAKARDKTIADANKICAETSGEAARKAAETRDRAIAEALTTAEKARDVAHKASAKAHEVYNDACIIAFTKAYNKAYGPAYAATSAEIYSQRLNYDKAEAEAEAKTSSCEEEFYEQVKGIAEALESAILKFEKNR